MSESLDAAAALRCSPPPQPPGSPAQLWMMTMNSLADSLLGPPPPPDPSKSAFLDFGLGPPPPSPHHAQQQPPPPPASLAPPYAALQALHPQPPQHGVVDSSSSGGAFPPSAPAAYGRPLAYPASYPGAAGSNPHAFYHHPHHHHPHPGASYSPYQQPSSALGHGTRLEETGKARQGEAGRGPFLDLPSATWTSLVLDPC